MADWNPPSTLREEAHAIPRPDGSTAHVVLREGDLLLLRWDRICPSAFIACANGGPSHTALVLANPDNGKLYVAHTTESVVLVSPEAAWPRSDGRKRAYRGTHAHLIAETLPGYKHMWVLRPHSPPWTRAQLDKATALLQRRIDETGGLTDAEASESLAGREEAPLMASNYEHSALAPEYLHACFGWPNATRDRWMCSEFTAELLRAAGRWPEDVSTSATPSRIVRVVGGQYSSVF